MRPSTNAPVSFSGVLAERVANVRKLQEKLAELHPVVQNYLQDYRKKSREAVKRGALPKFTEGDFVLVARSDFHAGEKLALRWRGPRRIIKALNDHVYQVEDLRNGIIEEAHVSSLKFYKDSSLDKEAIMPHVLSSETGMPVSRLLRLLDTEDGIKVLVRWKGLPDTEDSAEPLQNVYEDVPQLLLKLLNRKNTPQDLAEKARTALSL